MYEWVYSGLSAAYRIYCSLTQTYVPMIADANSYVTIESIYKKSGFNQLELLIANKRLTLDFIHEFIMNEVSTRIISVDHDNNDRDIFYISIKFNNDKHVYRYIVFDTTVANCLIEAYDHLAHTRFPNNMLWLKADEKMADGAVTPVSAMTMNDYISVNGKFSVEKNIPSWCVLDSSKFPDFVPLVSNVDSSLSLMRVDGNTYTISS